MTLRRSPPKRGKPPKRTGAKRRAAIREAGDAHRKVEEEGRCRNCGAGNAVLHAAHIVPRRHDSVVAGPRGGKRRHFHPDNCAPLCATGRECHRLFDAGEISLMGKLKRREYAHAIRVLGKARARRRVTGGGS